MFIVLDVAAQAQRQTLRACPLATVDSFCTPVFFYVIGLGC